MVFLSEPKLKEFPDFYRHFESLDWRLEGILQTRGNLVKKAEPIVTIQMTMEDGEKILFESQPNLIQEFTEEI